MKSERWARPIAGNYIVYISHDVSIEDMLAFPNEFVASRDDFDSSSVPLSWQVW